MAENTQAEGVEAQRQQMAPFLTSFYVLILASLLLLLMKGGGLGGSIGLSGGGLSGEIPDFAEAAARHAAFYRMMSGSNVHVFFKLASVTSRNQAKRDFFALQEAIIDGNEGSTLTITEKYKEVGFLPGYVLPLDASQRQQIENYASEKGRAATISKLMKPKSVPDSWPYRDRYLAALEENKKEITKGAMEVWGSCPISEKPQEYVNISGTGPLATSMIQQTPIEDPSTAGDLVLVKDLSGEPVLDVYGQKCYLREAYARDWMQANQCMKDSTKEEIVYRYCYRPAKMQAVVRFKILGATPTGGKCGMKMPGILKSMMYATFGGGPAAAPGHSNHNYGGAVDVDFMNEEALRKCLPVYWDNSVEHDEGHWEVNPNREQDVIKDIVLPGLFK